VSYRDTAVIIVAAGAGSRFGAAKQFELLGDLPMYQAVTKTIATVAAVDLVILVGREEDLDSYSRGLLDLDPPVDWVVVAGGATRQESVRRGLDVAKSHEGISIVLVHDVARALVASAVIDEIIEATRLHGSAIAAVPVVDSLKRASDGRVGETVSREDLWRAQTPQGAKLSLLLTAHEQAVRDGHTGTDESELLERVGERPFLVRSSEENFKITYPEDLERARRIFDAR
jgi:2-C-methyl-D-erythritol 4-phosphate cytidylyltransferase